MAKSEPTETRDRYRFFTPVHTRWMDNDIFGHVNNVVYYSYLDTTITNYYLDHGMPDLANALVIPIAAETRCIFKAPITHPARVEAGLRADRIGNRSNQCSVAFFLERQQTAVSWGHMVHVWTNRVTGQSVPIPAVIRGALEQIRGPEAEE